MTQRPDFVMNDEGLTPWDDEVHLRKAWIERLHTAMYRRAKFLEYREKRQAIKLEDYMAQASLYARDLPKPSFTQRGTNTTPGVQFTEYGRPKRPLAEVLKNHGIHEAIDRYVSIPDNPNMARLVEEALWWSVTPEMTARQAELEQKEHFGELPSHEAAQLARIRSRIALASKFSQERLTLAVSVAEALGVTHQVVTPWVPDPDHPDETRVQWKERTFLERYGFLGNKPTSPDTRIVTGPAEDRVREGYLRAIRENPEFTELYETNLAKFNKANPPYPAIQECDCTEGTVCRTHQGTLSDGRAVCIPFHPKSAIRTAMDTGYPENLGHYCARCGYQFREPAPTDLLGLDKPAKQGVCETCGQIVWLLNTGWSHNGPSEHQAMAEVKCAGCIGCGGPDCIERPGCTPAWGNIGPGGPAFIDDCLNCQGRIGWVECPTGGWWAHKDHPEDGHDAESRVLYHEPHGACPGWPPGQLE